MPLPPFTLLPYNDALVVEATLHQTERNLMAESQCHGVGVQTYFGAAEIVGDMTGNTEVTELLSSRPSVRNPVCCFAERRFGPVAANFNVA
jgi:hypothetical protein